MKTSTVVSLILGLCGGLGTAAILLVSQVTEPWRIITIAVIIAVVSLITSTAGLYQGQHRE